MTGTGDEVARPRPVAPGARARVGLAPRLAAVVSGLALLAGVGLGVARTLVHQCVHLDGPLALLGVRLTLVQDAADCPTGTLALAPAPAHGALLAIGLVVPVIAAHTALLALGTGLLAWSLRVARGTRAVLTAAVRSALRPGPRAVAAPRRLAPVVGAPARRARSLVHVVHPHRGPPVALA